MTLRSSEAHGAEQARLAALTGRAVERMAMAPDAVHESWLAAIPAVLRVTVQAQITATSNGPLYVANALAEQNIDVDPDVDVITRPLIGVAGDGRPLDTLADVPRWQALDQISAGVNPVAAVEASLATLTTMMATAVQDAGRASESLAMAVREDVGWVRMAVGDSCSRCIALLGRTYKSRDAFDRHPKDDCIHIPTRENVAGDVMTSPRAYFDQLSEADQNRKFTEAGARAIREGADISQVVNARRGMTKATSGRQVRNRDGAFTTTEGATRRRGRPARLMPESIAEVAEDRADYLRLLRSNGYIR